MKSKSLTLKIVQERWYHRIIERFLKDDTNIVLPLANITLQIGFNIKGKLTGQNICVDSGQFVVDNHLH
jgi:hypothetical protein